MTAEPAQAHRKQPVRPGSHLLDAAPDRRPHLAAGAASAEQLRSQRAGQELLQDPRLVQGVRRHLAAWVAQDPLQLHPDPLGRDPAQVQRR